MAPSLQPHAGNQSCHCQPFKTINADMNNEPKELKPCAHCGVVPQNYEGDDYVVIHVAGCAIATYIGSCNHWIVGPKVIKAWQTRATPDAGEIVEILKNIAITRATKIGGVE